MAKSVEEQVEEWAKKSLDDCGVRHFAKNAVINAEIGTALKTAASKSGGRGGNRSRRPPHRAGRIHGAAVHRPHIEAPEKGPGTV